jgi:hypothetical protein
MYLSSGSDILAYSLDRSRETKKSYLYSIHNYCQWVGVNDPNKLITEDLITSSSAIHKVEDKLIEYITFLRNSNQSYNTIHVRLAAITHFYTINRVNLNKSYIPKFKPINRKVILTIHFTLHNIHARSN